MVDFLNPKEFRVKVSSVLNRNVKEFGKQFLFDGKEDTCWNSDQGTPQLIQVWSLKVIYLFIPLRAKRVGR